MNVLEETSTYNKIISKINNIINQNGLTIKDRTLIKALRNLRTSRSFKNFGFIGTEDWWSVEYEWVGYEDLSRFLLSIPHPVRAYKLWIELFTGFPLYSWKNKPIWWSIIVKPTQPILVLAPDLIRKTILIQNRSKFFESEGFSGNEHFIKGTVAKFRKYFIEDFNMSSLGISKKRKYTILRKELFRQFKIEHEHTLFNELTKRRQRPNLFILKYDKDKFHASWVRKYYETNRRHAWRGDRGAKKVIEYFDSYIYSRSLQGEPIDYIITSSEISFNELIDKVRRNEIKSLEDILIALKNPRDTSRIFLEEFNGTKDVKPPLLVDTTNFKKYKDETFPEGQNAVIQSLFQINRIIKKLNQRYNVEIPLNGVYRFMGQSRGRSATSSTVFEDISATKDKLGYPLPKYINILVKNSNEFIIQRFVEDQLFKILSFPLKENLTFIIADITHPEDMESYELPECVQKAHDNYDDGYALGWIDIGIYPGSESVRNLASIYGAVKYSRTKDSIVDHVDAAERILLSHHVTGVSKDLISDMDELFERHHILNISPRDLHAENFVLFTIDFVKKFLYQIIES